MIDGRYCSVHVWLLCACGVLKSASAFAGFHHRPLLSPAFRVGTPLTSHYVGAMSPASAFNTSYSSDRTFFYQDKLDEDTMQDVASIEFLSAKDCDYNPELCAVDDGDCEDVIFPFASMLRGSARYIADHSQRTAVFYIPGDQIERAGFSSLMGDIALLWMLGLKICLVLGGRFDVACSSLGFAHPHECHNSLRVTDNKLLREIEEEAGFIRIEVERMLNRHLRLQGGTGDALGNVVGGNFYTARPFGVVEDVDYKNTGYPTKIHTERIRNSMENNDIVVLSTVGMSRLGDLVNVNGQHLAATVAASLQARKLVYMANSDTIMRRKGAAKTMQEVPLSLTNALLDYYEIKVNQAGFASFENAQKKLQPGAVELLLHLGWAAWALDQGVNRAHIVNPGDGTLLEELFSSKLGLNTCLYHEDEADDLDIDDM